MDGCGHQVVDPSTGELEGAALKGAHDGDGSVWAEAFAVLSERALKVLALATPQAVAMAQVALHFLAFDVKGSDLRFRRVHAHTIPPPGGWGGDPLPTNFASPPRTLRRDGR
jgi:hypothetical protein